MPLRSVSICLALLPLTVAAATERIYQDPPGRFTVAVPDQWIATSQDTGGMGGVQLRHDASWILIGPFGGAANGPDAVAQLTDQFAGQYRSLTPVKQGDCKVGGMPAKFATFDAVNSRGARVALTLIGVDSATAGVFVVIACAPQKEAADAAATLDHVRETVKWYEPDAITPPGKQ
jgi:hypothetical protein